jgi:hypothetical protein
MYYTHILFIQVNNLALWIYLLNAVMGVATVNRRNLAGFKFGVWTTWRWHRYAETCRSIVRFHFCVYNMWICLVFFFFQKNKKGNMRKTYKVVQIWPGRFVCKQVTVCPGHIWTTLLYWGAFTKPLLQWKRSKNYMWVCGWVHSFVWMKGRGRVLAASVALLIQHATRMRHIAPGLPSCTAHSDVILQTARFSKKKKSYWTWNVYFDFPYNFHLRISHSNNNSATYIHKCENVSM